MNTFQPINSEENSFCRHIKDLAAIGGKSHISRFSGFLTEREQQLAKAAAFSFGVSCCFWGGYNNAVRKIFCAPEDTEDSFPLDSVTFRFREKDKLTHRDFLGALMSLGLKRDQIGDILVANGAAVVFVTQTVSSLVLNEIDKVGRVGVKAESGVHIQLPEQEFEEMSVVVASPRIDALVSAVCGISRDKASALIRTGGVVVGGIQVNSTSKNVNEGEIFSVKGYGKFVFSQIGLETKKGKNHAVIKKYK